LFAFAAQPRVVAEIDIDRVDGLHLGGRGSCQAETPRKLVRCKEMSVAVAVLFRAEFDRQILRAPGEPLEPLARAAIGAGEKYRLRGFGCNRDDVERAVSQPVNRFAR